LEEDGVKHIQLSGGEPLERFDDLISIIKIGAIRVDFWLLTSALGLTAERAFVLKNAGLVGVNISLDHWKKNKHNEFRGNEESFDWVMKAIDNCRKAGIIVSLSLCATNEFVSDENLFNYIELARDKGVHFVRILEARRVGRFEGEDVLLKKLSIETLQEFVSQINSEPKYANYPILNFVGFHQRRIGCHGAGDRYLYIDANGDFHACPFCQGKMGNVFGTSIDDARANLMKRGCHYLPKVGS
jgi:MoaA/NifB/PqqE/SkfB family radical SAM enzyme